MVKTSLLLQQQKEVMALKYGSQFCRGVILILYLSCVLLLYSFIISNIVPNFLKFRKNDQLWLLLQRFLQANNHIWLLHSEVKWNCLVTDVMDNSMMQLHQCAEVVRRKYQTEASNQVHIHRNDYDDWRRVHIYLKETDYLQLCIIKLDRNACNTLFQTTSVQNIFIRQSLSAIRKCYTDWRFNERLRLW
jgi:hypothetical protein